MDGVELPCGSIMRVEPADCSYDRNLRNHYSRKKGEPNREDHLSHTHGEVKESDARKDTAAEEEDDDELDEFFNSL
jgi:hypothetical protein